MWILNFIPDSWIQSAVNLVFYVGIGLTLLGFFFSFIPFVSRYKLPLQILGVLLLAGGIYFKGGYAIELEWRAKVNELEKKVQLAEQKSKEANAKIETKIVERTKVIKQNVEVLKKEIQVQKEFINKECTLNDTAIKLYNDSVTNNQEATK